jgi:hypothetical protein
MATTTPNYGWDVPTSSDYVKNGATAIETLGDDIDATLWTALGGNYPGLRLIKKQTVGTGVTSVVVTSAFSATYESYKIVLANVTMSSTSAATTILTRMHDGTNPAITNYNYGIAGVDLANGNYTNFRLQLGASGILVGTGTGDKFGCNYDIVNPFIAAHTLFPNISLMQISSGYCGSGSGMHQTSTSYSAFDIRPSTGTLTGGTIYVYGYGAS